MSRGGRTGLPEAWGERQCSPDEALSARPPWLGSDPGPAGERSQCLLGSLRKPAWDYEASQESWPFHRVCLLLLGKLGIRSVNTRALISCHCTDVLNRSTFLPRVEARIYFQDFSGSCGPLHSLARSPSQPVKVGITLASSAKSPVIPWGLPDGPEAPSCIPWQFTDPHSKVIWPSSLSNCVPHKAA